MSLVTPAPPASAPPDGTGFQRRIGPFDATMLVAGSMIGSGIFIVSADIVRDVGSTSGLLLVWLVTGLLTVCGALSYAELAAMMPRAGGQYVFLREAYSPLWGFLYGWTLFLVIQTGTIAAVGVAFGKFLGVLAPSLGTGDAAILWRTPMELHLKLPLPWLQAPLVLVDSHEFTVRGGQLVGAALVVLLTLLNCRGVQEGKVVQNVFTVAKTLALAAVIVLGVLAAGQWGVFWENVRDHWNVDEPTKPAAEVMTTTGVGFSLAWWMVAGGAMVGSLFSSDAWNNVTFAAGEVRKPRRTLPLSLVCGTGLVTILYLLANVAYLTALPVNGDKAKADAGEILSATLREESSRLVGVASAAKSAQDADKWGVRAGALRAEADRLALEATRDFGIANARDDRVGTAVMQLAFPKYGAPLMAIAIMVSTFGCLNGLILAGARLYWAMARDGLFFRPAGTLNSRGVPAAGLLMQAAWSVLLIFSGTYGDLLNFVIFAALLFYVLTVSGLFVLRAKRPEAERPYRVLGYPVLPLVYIVASALIMLDLLIVRPKFTWPGLFIVLTGLPVYFLWRQFGRPAPVSPVES
jgi:APA family basic amino acid/polyamine antiporter